MRLATEVVVKFGVIFQPFWSDLTANKMVIAQGDPRKVGFVVLLYWQEITFSPL